MHNNPIGKAITAALASTNPLTSAIFSGIATYHHEFEMRFVRDVIIEVNKRVYRLEKRIDKEYIHSDDYKNFLHKTISMATKDVRKEKINLFSNIIVNAALTENANEDDGRKYLFDETIDKIDEILFQFLLTLSSRVFDNSGLETKGWTDNDDDLQLLGVDCRTFQYNSEYLISVGVMIRIPKFDLGDNGVLTYHEEYFVTQYGKEFVEYIREQ